MRGHGAFNLPFSWPNSQKIRKASGPKDRSNRLDFSKKLFYSSIAFLLCYCIYADALAQEIRPLTPSEKDKCPVCGMFVHKYPEWIAQIIFKDGGAVFFDGVKDMVKYYLNIKKYDPKREISDIAAIYVKDYYSLNDVEAKKAFYVLGSDVYGPMGKELIPFENEAKAKEFMKDHRGKMVLTFKDINAEVLRLLE